MFDTEAWIKTLTEGDQIACNFGSYGYESYKILTVIRVTPTGIVKCIHDMDTKNIYEFNTKGYERGAKVTTAFNRRRLHIEPLTAEIMDKIETRQLLLDLSSLDLKKMPLKYLRKLWRVYDEYKWDRTLEEHKEEN